MDFGNPVHLKILYSAIACRLAVELRIPGFGPVKYKYPKWPAERVKHLLVGVEKAKAHYAAAGEKRSDFRIVLTDCLPHIEPGLTRLEGKNAQEPCAI